MKKIVLLLILFTFYSCFKTEDDSNALCITDCTVLQGRAITSGNQPLPGVRLTFQFQVSSPLSSYTRIISDVTSDNNGNFYDDFYLTDREIDSSRPGILGLHVDEEDLNLNESIITPNKANILLSRPFYIDTRGTIIDHTYYFPKKTFVTVHLNNFVPIQANDRFSIRPLFPYGFVNPDPDVYNDLLETEYVATNGPEYEATQVNNSFNVLVAMNEKNIIRIYKFKNGVYSYDEVLIDVTSNNPNPITLDY